MVLNIKQPRSLWVRQTIGKSEHERRRWLTRIPGNGPETNNFKENFSASEYRSQFKVRCRSCLEIQDTTSLVVISQFYLHSFASYRLLNGRKLDSFWKPLFTMADRKPQSKTWYNIIFFSITYSWWLIDLKMSSDTWFRRRNFPYLNSRIFKIHFRTSDRLHLCTNFEVNKHTSALLSTNEFNSIQPWKEELFRISLKEKCALCFKIVLV